MDSVDVSSTPTFSLQYTDSETSFSCKRFHRLELDRHPRYYRSSNSYFYGTFRGIRVSDPERPPFSKAGNAHLGRMSRKHTPN